MQHTASDFTPEMREHPERYVPPGWYCYRWLEDPWTSSREGRRPRAERCPFWDCESDFQEQGNGYCWLLHWSDWGCTVDELDRPWDPETGLEGRDRECWLRETGGVVPEGWAGRTYREWVLGSEAAYDAEDDALARTLHFGRRQGTMLLWDRVKECSINEDRAAMQPAAGPWEAATLGPGIRSRALGGQA